MANTTVVMVKVEELSKFGYKANGKYVNYSKQLSDADKARVVPGAEFEAEYFVADSGKEYLNKVLRAPGNTQGPATGVDTARAKKFTPKYEKKGEAISAGLSKDEWAAKDRRISRQGCIQVAVQVESTFEKAAELAEKMLEFVNA